MSTATMNTATAAMAIPTEPRAGSRHGRPEPRPRVARLVLLRHGESMANAGNRFAGWDDAALTGRGRHEALEAGNRLRRAGLRFEVVHTSVLQRAIDTGALVLQALGGSRVSVLSSWRLNERHYGALQGLSRDAAVAHYGAQAVQAWRRSRDACPPALDDAAMRLLRADLRYADLPSGALPCAESLRDAEQRLLPYWQHTLAPALAQGVETLVVSHGNTLRALRRLIEGLSDDSACDEEIATGQPLVYTVMTGRHAVLQAPLP